MNDYYYYTLIPYRYYDTYEEAYNDYHKTINLEASDMVKIVQNELKNHDNTSIIDHNIDILYDKINIDTLYIDKYNPNPRDIVYLASIENDNNLITKRLSNMNLDVLIPTFYNDKNYTHITDSINDINKNLFKINRKLMDTADLLLIPTIEDDKDMMNRYIYIEISYMANKSKPIYMLYNYTPTTFWGFVVKELDGITILNGDLSLLSKDD